MGLSYKAGSTDKMVRVRVVDSADGTPETGVVYNTAGIALWYQRDGGAKVPITPASLSALTDAHTDGGFLHISDGYARVDVPDAAYATGSDSVLIGGSADDMVFIGTEVQLVGYNPRTELTTAVLALISTIAADVWAYASRTLTQTVTQIAAALDGDELNIQRGDKIEFTQTIGAITGWTKLYFYLKEAKDTADNDALIWIQVTDPADAVNDGLKRLNGASSTLSYGSLTVADETTGEIDFMLLDTASVSLVSQPDLYYGWKWVDASGNIFTKAMGRANINEAIGEAIS